MQYHKQRTQSKFSPVMWGLLAAFMIAALITAYLTFVVVRDVFSGGKNVGLPNPPGSSVDSNSPARNPFDISAPLQSPGGPTPDAWDGASRVTVLVVGLDLRDWEENQGPSRTDSMILFTVDPTTRSAGMLSIPRDLWVNIPGYGYGKINTAYFLGELYQEPGGGPGLAVKTVEEFLGVPINYYAQIDFSAFVRFVDEIGGIQINVPEEITIDPLGPHNTVTLQPGSQKLDGATTLAYARARYTIGGDFDRSQRQQQVILAIRDQILSKEMLPQLIQKAPVLYNELSSGVHTNLSINEAIKLAWLASQIQPENITHGAIGPDQVTTSMSPDGLDILLPNTDAVRELRDTIFTATGPVGPAATIGDPKVLVAEEGAKVTVLNGTMTPGLASQTMEFLNSKGVNVVSSGNAEEATASTTIIDYTGKPYTIQYLIDVMKIPASRVYRRYDPNSQVDVAVILGDDWAQDNPMP